MTRQQMRSKWRSAATIHFYLALGVGWGAAMLFVTPTVLSANLNNPVGNIAWTGLTIAGGLVASLGLMQKLSQELKRQKVGQTVELVGIVMLAAGPFIYGLIQVSLWLTAENGFKDRFALTVFCYAMLAAVGTRLAAVLPEIIADWRKDRA